MGILIAHWNRELNQDMLPAGHAKCSAEIRGQMQNPLTHKNYGTLTRNLSNSHVILKLVVHLGYENIKMN